MLPQFLTVLTRYAVIHIKASGLIDVYRIICIIVITLYPDQHLRLMATTLLTELIPLLKGHVSDTDRQRARLHVLDWLGCALLGAATETGEKLSILQGSLRSAGNICMTGRGKADIQTALLYNGALGNILEMDDVHRTSILHPGPVVIPAAIAVAQHVDATQEALLNAIIVGYEAMIRIGRSFGPAHYQYWHNTSTAGAFGAAAAACELLKLNDTQWINALANAGTRTGGLWQMRHENTQSKQLHNGWAALTGVQAAIAARAGISGPASLLEGKQGLLAATAKGGIPEAVISEIDAPWLLWHCSFKPWPACRHTHPAIDAALKVDTPLTDIDSVTLETYDDALRFCDNPKPQNELEAKFSLQHAIAIALVRGEPTLGDFDADSRSHPKLTEWRDKISVCSNQMHQLAYPNAYGATLTLSLTNGQRLVIEVDDVLGDPGNPMTTKQIIAKANTLFSAAGVSLNHQRDLMSVLTADSDELWVEALANALPSSRVAK